jgi:hypothetical protein
MIIDLTVQPTAGEVEMSTPKLALLALMLSVLTIPPARAQVTIDVAKITCEQFISWSVTDPRYIVLWLSGYYAGKGNNTIVDQENLKDNGEKIRNYCRNNRTATVMKAVEAVIGVK